jgi:glutaminyl-tRNA synthetase
MSDSPSNADNGPGLDFIRQAVSDDLVSGRFKSVRTRLPPEPNGWMHIGHAKAFSIDYYVAKDFGGVCNLRFDDTNPAKEDMSYVEAIKRDTLWLGLDCLDHVSFASDYYEQMYELAIKLIKKGVAYVDDLSEDETREYRGTAVPDKNNITVTPPGKNSPWRDRGVEENLDLFARMRAGEFADGSKTLRARIDMAHPNLVMRDPVMYRIKRAPHYRTGNAWCIYPMYDFQEAMSDAIEGITHSLCSLEYEIHRPLYEWFIKEAEVFPSRQIEFSRLNITHTVLSKRYLLRLVQDKYVSGWDDPRMPTIAGLRRRGYTPEAIRDFITRIGVAKTDSLVDIQLLEHCLREDLNRRAARVMAVLRPVKLIIDNWPAGKVEELEAVNNPEDPGAGTRKVPFSGELYIERDDFMETPPPKYYRLYPGNSVRLRYGYIVTCTGFRKDPSTGEVTEVHCDYDPATKGGDAPDNRKVKGTIHWVSAKEALPIEARLYDYLFPQDRPMDVPEGVDWVTTMNPASLEVLSGAFAEPSLSGTKSGASFQFERLGYFVCDPDSKPGKLVFNRSVSLRDSWAKIEKKGA